MMDANLFGHAAAARRPRWRCLPCPGSYPAARVPIPIPPPVRRGPRRVRVVDSFAGGGGASNGIRAALRQLDGMGLLPAGHPLDVDFAVNHDDAALCMHAANHPDTIHLPANVWQVSMRETLGDDLFGLLWLSPDCRDHSAAKGGPITSRAVRDLAWVAVKWLKELPDWQRPWIICLENVSAFAKWSPLVERPDGAGFMRDPDRLGWTFHQFVHALSRFGYSVGWKVIVACEHGDPTIRRRLKLVARRDGLPVEWPEPTHGDPKSEAVKSGRLQPWPVAADILDWSHDCPSIFLTKEEARAYTTRTGKRIIRPLARKTDARLAYGVKRHVIDAGDDAFLTTCNHSGDAFRGQAVGEPFATVTRARDAHGIVVPHLMTMRNSGAPTSAAGEPARTVMAGGANQFAVEAAIVPHLSAYYGEGQGGSDRSAPAGEPLRTAPTQPRHALVAASIVGVGGRMGQSAPRSVGRPWQSTTTKPDSAICAASLVPWPESAGAGADLWDLLPPAWRAAALKDVSLEAILPFIAVFRGDSAGRAATAPLPTPTVNSFIKRPGGAAPLGVGAAIAVPFIKRDFGNSVGTSILAPTGAVTSGGGGKMEVVEAAVAPFVSRGQHGGGNRAAGEPLHTVAASDGDQNQVVAVYVAQHNNDSRRATGTNPGRPAGAPLSTATVKGIQQGVVAASMLSLKGSSRRDGSAADPHVAVCASGQHSAVVTLPLVTAYYSSGGQHARVDDPSLTVPTKARFGLTEVEATAPPLTEAQWKRARQVAEFLRFHGCWDGGEIVTLTIRGVLYVIVDIGMRMLTPRELARAQGFPDSYILDPIFNGKPLSETEQRHKIGNSVCEKPAAAVIVANYRPPMEWGVNAAPFMEAAE